MLLRTHEASSRVVRVTTISTRFVAKEDEHKNIAVYSSDADTVFTATWIMILCMIPE